MQKAECLRQNTQETVLLYSKKKQQKTKKHKHKKRKSLQLKVLKRTLANYNSTGK